MSDNTLSKSNSFVNDEETKFCLICKRDRSIYEFELRKDTGRRRNQCIECLSEKLRIRYATDEEFSNRIRANAIGSQNRNYSSRRQYIREWQARNKDRVNGYAKDNYYKNRQEFIPCITKTLYIKKSQCKKSGLSFEITAQDIQEIFESQGGMCTLTGRRLLWGESGVQRDTLSIDRIDQSIGYKKSNIRLVTYQANFARNKFSDDELVEFCRLITDRYNKDPTTFGRVMKPFGVELDLTDI